LGFQSIIKHESQEAAAAYQDHDAVATWILQSLGSPESAQIPTSVAQVLYPFLAPYGGFDKPPISVPPAYVRIGQLSKAILRKRIAIDDRLSKAYTLAQVGALTSILIGLVTTVLVALSSSEVGKQQTRAALTIRIGALVFPARNRCCSHNCLLRSEWHSSAAKPSRRWPATTSRPDVECRVESHTSRKAGGSHSRRFRCSLEHLDSALSGAYCKYRR
jgi:hypothetical protein